MVISYPKTLHYTSIGSNRHCEKDSWYSQIDDPHDDCTHWIGRM